MRWPASDAVMADQLEESGLRKPLGQLLTATGVDCGCPAARRAAYWSRPHGPDCLMWRLAELLGVTDRFVNIDNDAALVLASTVARQVSETRHRRLSSHIRIDLLECGPWGKRQVDLCDAAWGAYVRSEAVRAAVAAGDHAIPGEALTAADIETARRAGFPINPDPMRFSYELGGIQIEASRFVSPGEAVMLEGLEPGPIRFIANEVMFEDESALSLRQLVQQTTDASAWARREYLGEFPTTEGGQDGETKAADLQGGREPAADRGGAAEPGPDGAVAGEGGEWVP